MANVTIVKLKVRRGSDAQRKAITLDQGELGYTLDTKRFYIGDGSTVGGHVIGSKVAGPFTSLANLDPGNLSLEVGDLAYANNKLFALTASNYNADATSLTGYAYVGTSPDDGASTAKLKFDSNNTLTVKPSSLNASDFETRFFGAGIQRGSGIFQGGIEVALNGNYLELSGGTISPIRNSITEREIKTTALSSGLQGGDNTVLRLNVDKQYFGFDLDEQLTWVGPGDIDVPVASFKNELASGLRIDSATSKLTPLIQTIDIRNFRINDGRLTLANSFSSSDTYGNAKEWPYLNVYDGQVTGIQSSIYDVITATGLSGSSGDAVPVGSILPHAAAWTSPPAGFLLCDGSAISRTTYNKLYNIIGTSYGTTAGDNFLLPKLNTGNVVLYGNDAIATGSADAYSLSGTTVPRAFGDNIANGAGATLSAVAVNFIIKYDNDPMESIFNGAPNQITHHGDMANVYNQQVYEGLNSDGENIQLSSAGFITFANGGTSRNSQTFDKFAIPVFNW
tara:strand:+ start:1474 stop:2997 length:1524 start_codon:yes stop_codon:yes gene_type:complete